MNSAVGRLVQAELRLMVRDPLVLTFVVAFPIVTMLIIGGAFGTQPDRAFDFVNPAHWYVASYLTVVIAAMGLVMLPVHLASYRERGVLRRFAAAGFPRWSFPISQLIVGLATTAVSCALLLRSPRRSTAFPRCTRGGESRPRWPWARSPSSASACCSARCSRRRAPPRLSAC